MDPVVLRDPEDPEYALFTHVCERGELFTSRLPTFGPGGWWWESENLRPSIKCLNCGAHGWWDGSAGWRRAPDDPGAQV